MAYMHIDVLGRHLLDRNAVWMKLTLQSLPSVHQVSHRSVMVCDKLIDQNWFTYQLLCLVGIKVTDRNDCLRLKLDLSLNLNFKCRVQTF